MPKKKNIPISEEADRVCEMHVCVRQKEKGAELKPCSRKLTRKYCECFCAKICENDKITPGVF